MAKFTVELQARDRIEVEIADDASVPSQVLATACTECLELLCGYQKMHGDFREWPIPTGSSHSEMLLRELLMRSRGQWAPSFTEAEICHCRIVPTRDVEQAILAGAHSLEKLQRWTGASTGCGTCAVDVNGLLEYHLSPSKEAKEVSTKGTP